LVPFLLRTVLRYLGGNSSPTRPCFSAKHDSLTNYADFGWPVVGLRLSGRATSRSEPLKLSGARLFMVFLPFGRWLTILLFWEGLWGCGLAGIWSSSSPEDFPSRLLPYGYGL